MPKRSLGQRTDTTKVRKAFRFRLYPTLEQERYLRRVVGATRYIYNVLVGEHERRMKHRRFFSRGPWPKPIGHQEDASLYQHTLALIERGGPAPWLVDVAGNVRNHACGNFENAQTRWMKGEGDPPKRHKREPSGSLQFQDAVVSASGTPEPACAPAKEAGFGFIRLPKPRHININPWIKFRRHRRLRGLPKTATITRAANRWYVSILCEWTPAKKPVHQAPTAAVGVDLNVRNLCALSTGELVEGRKREILHIERIIVRLQRQDSKLRRTERAAHLPMSKRHRRLTERLAKLKDRQANLRREVSSQLAHRLAHQNALIGVEDLDIKAMTASAKGTPNKPGKKVRQKAGLNRAILSMGWGQFRTKLEVKAAMYGGQVIRVPAEFTSQTCARCGHVERQNRDGANFRCVACGHSAHADINAAENILERALRLSAQAAPGTELLDGERATKSRPTTRQRTSTGTRGAPHASVRLGATAPRSMATTSDEVTTKHREVLAEEKTPRTAALAPDDRYPTLQEIEAWFRAREATAKA